MAEVSTGSTTQIKNGIGGIVLNRIQKRRIVLADVVIPTAIPVCLGHPIIVGDRHFLIWDATARHRLEVAHKTYPASYYRFPHVASENSIHLTRSHRRIRTRSSDDLHLPE